MTLHEQLAQCESDTRYLISVGAANRLANWRNYNTQSELIMFIQRLIRNPVAMANGWELHRAGLISLESIVLSNQDLFTVEDVNVASRTLGLRQ